jgi:hypothetical protein
MNIKLRPGFYGNLGIETYSSGAPACDKTQLLKDLYKGSATLVPESYCESITPDNVVTSIRPLSFLLTYKNRKFQFHTETDSEGAVIQVRLPLWKSFIPYVGGAALTAVHGVRFGIVENLDQGASADWNNVETKIQEAIDLLDDAVEQSSSVYKMTHAGSIWDYKNYGFQDSEEQHLIANSENTQFEWTWLDWFADRRIIAVPVKEL